MSLLTIKTTDGKTAFKPFEQIKGKISWQLDKQTDSLMLSLIWQTSGRGSVKTTEVSCLEIENPQLIGEKEFSFEVPEGPYSYIGKFLQIHWRLELKAGRKDKETKGIIIGPNGVAIDCTEAIIDKIGK
ncbi:MAG: hypothetical protein AB7F23_02780 [Phycisphaerae bacterium]